MKFLNVIKNKFLLKESKKGQVFDQLAGLGTGIAALLSRDNNLTRGSSNHTSSSFLDSITDQCKRYSGSRSERNRSSKYTSWSSR